MPTATAPTTAVRCKVCRKDMSKVDSFHTVPGWKGVFCDGCAPAPGSTNLSWHDLVADGLGTAGKCVEEFIAENRSSYCDAEDYEVFLVPMTVADMEAIRRAHRHAEGR